MAVRVSGMLRAVLLGGLCFLGAGSVVQAQPEKPAAVETALPESLPASQGNPQLDGIKTAFQKRFPEIEVSGVRPTPFSGLYEVQIGMDVVYTNARADYILQGSLIDTKTRTDLTAIRLTKLAEVPFDSLPLDLAVKQVKGDGSRKMAIFEDPNCGYCKQLHQSLKKIDNTTLYTFLFPILSPDSKVKARNIWCAKDQAATWSNWMLKAETPPEATCSTPVDKVLALGKKLMVRGTPAIIFADGSRVNGALPLADLKEKLDSLK